VTAVVAVATCCGFAAATALRGGSPVAAAVPPVALGALDEHLLVGTTASDLSALTGARGGTIGAALSTRRQEFERQPIEIRASGEATAYLKVDKPRFLFLEGSPDPVAAAGVATTVLPDASAARAGASATHVVPSVDRLVAGASAPAPGAGSSATSAALGEGAQAPTSQGGLPPVALLLLFLSRRRILRGRRGRESLLLAQPEFLVPLLPALPPPDPSLLLARRPLLLPPLRPRALGLGAWAGRTARRSRSPSAGKSET
jgi:hypothetical protein